MKRIGRISDSCLNKEVSKNRTPFSKKRKCCICKSTVTMNLQKTYRYELKMIENRKR